MNFDKPHKALVAQSLVSEDDMNIQTVEEKLCSGTAKTTKNWSVGLFAKFINAIILGGEASYNSTSSSEVKYSCASMKTRRFTPSRAYIDEVVKAEDVKNHFLMSGTEAKVFYYHRCQDC